MRDITACALFPFNYTIRERFCQAKRELWCSAPANSREYKGIVLSDFPHTAVFSEKPRG